jgi:membrane-associated phospholipid phosphatase
MAHTLSRVCLCDDARMRLRAAIGSLGALALLAVLTVLVVHRWVPLERFDAAVSGLARRHPFGLPAWRLVTHVGDSWTLAVLGALVLTYLLLRGRRLDAAVVVVGASLTHVLELIMKAAVARDRPVDRFTDASYFSYPSGHTVHSATAALLLAYLFAVRWVPIVVAVLIGVSRVVLLAHWPTDVLGGWLLVLGVLPLLFIATDAVRRRSPPAAPSPAGPHSSAPPDPPNR